MKIETLKIRIGGYRGVLIFNIYPGHHDLVKEQIDNVIKKINLNVQCYEAKTKTTQAQLFSS